MTHPTRRETIGLGAALTAALAADPAQARGPDVAFTLVLVNDIYRMQAVEGRGGFAKLAAIVKAERARGGPVLVCHAGDTFSPSLMSGFDKGRHIIDLTNRVRPDVFVPGNHEFDFGQAVFRERLAEATFPVLAANLRQADGSPVPGLRDTALLTLGGIAVGVVGIALPETPAKSQSGDWRFGPALETLRAGAGALRAAGADFVLAVTHTDRPTDEALVASRLADAVLSGHDHDLALHYDGRTVFAESGEEANVVTAIDIRVAGRREGRLAWVPRFRVTDSIDVEPDPEVQAVVDGLQRQLSADLDRPLGRTDVSLDTRVAAVRAAETAFGDLVADALRAATGAALAITNGGGIRGNRLYPPGTVLTARDVLTELPFGNTTVLVEITGGQVRAALENGYAEFGHPSGRFAHISGMTVTVAPEAPVGERVTEIRVAGAPLDPTGRYTVASNNFMLGGGNGYGMLAEGRTLIGGTDGTLLSEAVVTYIRQSAPLSIATGRIRTR